MTDMAHPPLINSQAWTRVPRLGAVLRRWRRRVQERRQLARLDERELRDIGQSHVTIYDELRKPFWRE